MTFNSRTEWSTCRLNAAYPEGDEIGEPMDNQTVVHFSPSFGSGARPKTIEGVFKDTYINTYPLKDETTQFRPGGSRAKRLLHSTYWADNR